MRATLCTIALSALWLAAAGCGEEGCLVFDYAPPSAEFTLVDVSTGQPICDADVTTADGRVVRNNPGYCNYELAAWETPVTLQLPGYEDVTVEFPAPVANACDEIVAPEPQTFELSPT